MAADFKSHVLLRDEKGVFGIPFKRLLIGGVGGGLVYTITGLFAPTWAIPIAVIFAISTVILTGLRGGIPLWQRLLLRWRGSLLLVASRFPNSPIAQFADLLNLPVDLMQLDGVTLFDAPNSTHEVDLREWITFAHAHEEDGLIFVDTPLKKATKS